MKKKDIEKKKKESSELTEEDVEVKNSNGKGTGNQDKKENEEESEEDSWKMKYEEVNDKYLRLYSEFDNFRRRTQKEKLELYKNAGEDIMAALLPVLDDFERAEKSMHDSKDVDSVKEGIDLIHQKLIGILKQKGLSPMETPVGKKFDLENQEAVTRIPAPSDDMKGKVIDEVEKGYKLNDKVIRFSKVVVGE